MGYIKTLAKEDLARHAKPENKIKYRGKEGKPHENEDR